MHIFRNGLTTDATRCLEIEVSAYEGDEAATFEKIAYRLSRYPEGFLVLEVDGAIAGFINSGCAFDVEMADEDFKDLVGHIPEAPNVVILSVVVDPTCQGNGYSRALMEEFIKRMSAMNKKTVHLMCREQHIALYEKFDFTYVKPSPSEHGGLAWHEMILTL